jgi:hypothetical protein
MAKKVDSSGPRGGKTTVTASGMVRKTLWLHGDEAEVPEVRAVAKAMKHALEAWQAGAGGQGRAAQRGVRVEVESPLVRATVDCGAMVAQVLGRAA